MAAHLFVVFLHIMISIVWIGYALFWAIIAGPVVRAYGTGESDRVLTLVSRAPWPPAKVPVPFRLRFSGVAWSLLVLLAATGLLLVLHEASKAGPVAWGAFWSGRFGGLLAAKLVFVLALAGLQVRLAKRPGPRLAMANLGIAVIVVALSALLARSVGK
ncbi:MAG: hypothetical protein EHM19_07760 [Candidatus Latescibacterota bacterium]|nr:MAG: hypothetical protein EHM19_07760 [Candidatus Latescibacterota bacterium]